jgi:putative endonuclease
VRILARNARSRLGEIDLVGVDGDTVIFVEVKTRSTAAVAPPQAAVDRRKRARLVRLAEAYVARHGLQDRRCRFDVVAVTFEAPGSTAASRIDHFRGAFTADGETV